MSRLLFNKPIKLIICDMAGTTVNDSGLVYQTLYNTIKGYDIYIQPEHMKPWYGAPKKDVLQHFINTDIEYRDNEAILPQMLHSFETKLKSEYQKPGNLSLIDANLPNLFNKLRANGIKIALNTGFSTDLQETVLDRLNMRHFIDGYISSESVERGRPAPDMIQELMRRFQINDPAHVAKIGDSVNDILEGQAAQCGLTIGVLTGADTQPTLAEHHPDYILPSVMHLNLHLK